jgi:hypothetical protein
MTPAASMRRAVQISRGIRYQPRVWFLSISTTTLLAKGMEDAEVSGRRAVGCERERQQDCCKAQVSILGRVHVRSPKRANIR